MTHTLQNVLFVVLDVVALCQVSSHICRVQEYTRGSKQSLVSALSELLVSVARCTNVAYSHSPCAITSPLLRCIPPDV